MPYYEFLKQASSIFITAAAPYPVQTGPQIAAWHWHKTFVEAVWKLLKCIFTGPHVDWRVHNEHHCTLKMWYFFGGLFSTLLHKVKSLTLLCFFLPGGLNSAHHTLPNQQWELLLKTTGTCCVMMKLAMFEHEAVCSRASKTQYITFINRNIPLWDIF